MARSKVILVIFKFKYLASLHENNLRERGPCLDKTRGSGGKSDPLSRLSTYGFLLPPNTFYEITHKSVSFLQVTSKI